MAIAPHDSLIAALSRPGWRDFMELTKPKVSLLIVFTAIVGMVLASPGMVPLPALVFGTWASPWHPAPRRRSITSSTGASIDRWRAPGGDLWRPEVCGRVRPLFSRVSCVWAQ